MYFGSNTEVTKVWNTAKFLWDFWGMVYIKDVLTVLLFILWTYVLVKDWLSEWNRDKL